MANENIITEEKHEVALLIFAKFLDVFLKESTRSRDRIIKVLKVFHDDLLDDEKENKKE